MDEDIPAPPVFERTTRASCVKTLCELRDQMPGADLMILPHGKRWRIALMWHMPFRRIRVWLCCADANDPDLTWQDWASEK